MPTPATAKTDIVKSLGELARGPVVRAFVS